MDKEFLRFVYAMKARGGFDGQAPTPEEVAKGIRAEALEESLFMRSLFPEDHH